VPLSTTTATWPMVTPGGSVLTGTARALATRAPPLGRATDPPAVGLAHSPKVLGGMVVVPVPPFAQPPSARLVLMTVASTTANARMRLCRIASHLPWEEETRAGAPRFP
jgi:hypothetical protein